MNELLSSTINFKFHALYIYGNGANAHLCENRVSWYHSASRTAINFQATILGFRVLASSPIKACIKWWVFILYICIIILFLRFSSRENIDFFLPLTTFFVLHSLHAAIFFVMNLKNFFCSHTSSLLLILWPIKLLSVERRWEETRGLAIEKKKSSEALIKTFPIIWSRS
jgi:hypothetical protein